MATTCQNIITTIRAANILPPTQVNTGVTDGLEPPYITLDGFEFEPEYQTAPFPVIHAHFHILCYHNSADNVQALAEKVRGLLNLSTTVTPTTSGCFLLHYRLGQTQENLYVWVVDMEFKLEENIG